MLSILFALQQIRSDGINFTHENTNIYLPPEVFSPKTSSFVATFVFLTLNEILLLDEPSGFGRGNSSRTEVTTRAIGSLVSSTVTPQPPAKLQSPVRIELETLKVGDNPNAVERPRQHFKEM